MKRNELIQAICDSDAQKLSILQSNIEGAKKAALDNPTKANQEAWAYAEKRRDEYLAQLQGAEAAVSFKNILDVFGYLREEGWKISKSKLYQDKGKFLVENGEITLESVQAYIDNEGLPRQDSSGQSDEMTKAQQRRTKAMAKREEVRAKREKLEYEAMLGKFMAREEHDQQVAALLSSIESLVKQSFQDRALELIELVGGSPEKEHELTEELKSMFDEEVSHLAQAAFTIEFVERETDEE